MWQKIYRSLYYILNRQFGWYIYCLHYKLQHVEKGLWTEKYQCFLG